MTLHCLGSSLDLARAHEQQPLNPHINFFKRHGITKRTKISRYLNVKHQNPITTSNSSHAFTVSAPGPIRLKNSTQAQNVQKDILISKLNVERKQSASLTRSEVIVRASTVRSGSNVGSFRRDAGCRGIIGYLLCK